MWDELLTPNRMQYYYIDSEGDITHQMRCCIRYQIGAFREGDICHTYHGIVSTMLWYYNCHTRCPTCWDYDQITISCNFVVTGLPGYGGWGWQHRAGGMEECLWYHAKGMLFISWGCCCAWLHPHDNSPSPAHLCVIFLTVSSCIVLYYYRDCSDMHEADSLWHPRCHDAVDR